MKKVAVVVLVLAISMLLLRFSSVLAESPMIPVSGLIKSRLDPEWPNTKPIITKEVGPEVFLYLRTASEWVAASTGGISGFTRGDQTWIIHTGEKEHVLVNATIVFTTATVAGRTGTMTVELLKHGWTGHTEDNHGTWRIKHAEGGLEGLQGGGDWLSSPNSYVGFVHFSKP